MAEEWFETWFDTPYYHLLYKHRNQEEAARFIDNLVKHLNMKPPAKVLDAACGKGRHAFYLHQKGFDVTGFDLSEQSVTAAKKEETEGLRFYVNDIRNVQEEAVFDYTFNLFTSFGYFDRDDENLTAVKAMALSLKQGGTLVLDFLNVPHVVNNLNPKSVSTIEGIEFTSTRKIENDWVIKEIDVKDAGETLHFKEQVKLITKKQFEQWFSEAGLKIVDTFGNYSLDPFDEETSSRLILIAKRQ